jgi:ATP-dependent RNA helicase RhlE
MQHQRYGNTKRYSRGRSKFGGNFSSSFDKTRRSNPYASAYIKTDLYVSKAVKENTESIYESNLTFSDFALSPILASNVSHKGYVHPTKIQAEIIPQILNNRDVLGVACTGSGKTAAYLIPMIDKILKNPGQKCLIIAPTRELTNQIRSEYFALTYGTQLKDVVIMGGASYSDQIMLIRRGPQFVIATPGRLLDLCDRKQLDLGSFNNIVLDEVDEMLDMGFIHDVKSIISKLNNQRQSLFFSATMSKKSEEVANSILRSPYKVSIEKQEAVKNVDQDIVRVDHGKNKIDVLHDLLLNADFKRVLVFSKTKRGAEEVANELRKRGHKSDSLHGNKSLGQRSKVLGMFRKFEINILVATDVASRGIDVPDITHVINYDPPATVSDYIHRVGRTGRMGKKGIALTFVR